jgi:putative Mn2+ efflux pump MntP
VNIFDIMIIALGLAMDAFAVAMCKGLEFKQTRIKTAIIVGIYFGVFQALMPLIGFYIGSEFSHYIEDVDHWIAFVLLTIIGLNMIIGASKEEYKNAKSKKAKRDGMRLPNEQDNDENKIINKKQGLTVKVMLPLAVATSIDALITGMSLGFMNVSIYISIMIIGVVTFILSFIGVLIGNILGSKFKTKAEIIGGVILISIGVKVLLTHLGIM